MPKNWNYKIVNWAVILNFQTHEGELKKKELECIRPCLPYETT